MSSVSRAHHYIPEFYLAGFTPSGSRDDYLWVFDKEKQKRWRSKPNAVACEKDFYQIRIPGFDPNTFEDWLSEIESRAAPVIKNMEAAETIPAGDDFVALMAFVAVMAARVPVRRTAIREVFDQISKGMLAQTLATPERYAAAVATVRLAGVDVREFPTYEDMRCSVEEDRFHFAPSKNWLVVATLIAFQSIFPFLIKRDWSLVIAQEQAGEYICSDCPVGLIWTVPVPAFYADSPGFGMRKTEVTFPLNKRMILVGRFEEESHISRVTNTYHVATGNSRTAMDAERFLYSTKEDFCWLRNDDRICNATELMEAHGGSVEEGTPGSET